MKRNATRAVAWAGVVWWGLLGASGSAAAPPTDTPPAPEMPSHWKVVADVDVPETQIEAIERTLGASISALRNTRYDVDGGRLQINTILARDAESAESLWSALREVKSEELLLRRGLVIYEFVGSNDMIPFMREGRQHIESETRSR